MFVHRGCAPHRPTLRIDRPIGEDAHNLETHPPLSHSLGDATLLAGERRLAALDVEDHDLDVTTIVQQWVDNPTANYGLILRAVSTALVEYELSSRESSNPLKVPHLYVRWGAETPTPVPPTPSPSSTAGSYPPPATATAMPLRNAAA